MDLLAVFMERYPGVQVKAKIGDSAKLIEDVIACRLDIAGVTGLEPDNRLVNIAYRDQPIILFVARNHPWARHVGISAAELNDQPMVARHGSSMTRRIFESRLNDRNIHPRILIELDSWEAMKAATAAGIGFGIALEDEFGHDDRLVGITLTDVDLSARQYFVCLPEFEQLRSVQAFLDVVRELQRPIVGQRGSFSAEAIADRDPVALPSYYSPHCIFPLPMTCFNKENPK
jgi:DNA-binding transcriptional LysR family regulator